MVQCPSADPRIGRPILKAIVRKTVAMPTARQTEAERPFWGAHPDPVISAIEEEFYGWGQDYLVGLLSGTLGRHVQPRSMVKAGFGPSNARIPGWGGVVDLFKSDADPAHLMSGWDAVVSKLTSALVPPGSVQGAAQALALKTHLMTKIGERVSLPPVLPEWMKVYDIVPASQAHSMEWTMARGMEFANNLTTSTRHALTKELATSKQAGENTKQLEKRLFDRFGQLNRDWRRIALTETAMAVENGALASVDPADGWVAVWICAPTACPFCLAQRHKKFKVVDPKSAARNPDTEVWVGKSAMNVTRSSSLKKKDGTTRTKDELWVPTCPAHPNCACTLSLKPAKYANKPVFNTKLPILKG